MTKAKSPSKSGIVTKVANVSSEKAYFDHMDSVLDSVGGKGTMLIVGLDGSDDEEEDEEEDIDEDKIEDNEKEKEHDETGHGDKKKKVLTSEDLSKLRYIIVTENRDKMLDQAIKFVTMGQQDDCMMMFNTHTGNKTIMQIPNKIKAAMKKSTFPLRFDSLFALTHALFSYDCWLHDNEMYGEGGEQSYLRCAFQLTTSLQTSIRRTGGSCDSTRLCMAHLAGQVRRRAGHRLGVHAARREGAPAEALPGQVQRGAGRVRLRLG